MLLLASVSGIAAEEKSGMEIPLYPGAAPGSEKWDWPERSVSTTNGLPMARDVVRPVLLYYPAERSKAAGVTMIVAPGAAHIFLEAGFQCSEKFFTLFC